MKTNYQKTNILEDKNNVINMSFQQFTFEDEDSIELPIQP